MTRLTMKTTLVAWLVVAALIVAMTASCAQTRPAGGAGNTGAPADGHKTATTEMPIDEATQEVIDRGLKFLEKAQHRDGSWTVGGKYASYPIVATSLAGLALVGEGSTPVDGKYKQQLWDAMHYLLDQQNDDGLFTNKQEQQTMFGQGYAMLFLSKCLQSQLDDPVRQRVQKALEKAAALCAKVQTDNGERFGRAGGWIYTPFGGGDEGAVTSIIGRGLLACHRAGVKVPPATLKRMMSYFRYSQDDDGGIFYSLQSKGGGRLPISAAAMLCISDLPSHTAAEKDTLAGVRRRLWDYLDRNAQSMSACGHYAYTNESLAAAQRSRGGQKWVDHYAQISKALRESQSKEGSWDTDGIGTGYSTAMALMILQLPKGHIE